MAGSKAENGIPGLIRGWLVMARIPFHSVGVMPYFLGTVLAFKLAGAFSLPVFALSTLAVVLIMLTTYTSGEYYDLEGDRLSARLERNQFTGGSQAVAQGTVPPTHALYTSYVSAAAAAVIGLVLQFHYQTGILTIPLGAVGLFSGFFYSTKPIRIVERGVGEVLIGFCYGWLPVATAFYLQTSHFDPLVHWMSLPIALTIFNVIFVNEFPDYPADARTGKNTLLVRIGKERGAPVYAATQVGAVITFACAILAGAPKLTWAFFPVVAAIGLFTAASMMKGEYKDRRKLERLCALTIVLNIFIAAAYIAGLLL